MFSRLKLEELQRLQTVTSNGDFEGKMSETELVFSRCCQAKCNTIQYFQNVVEQSVTKNDALDMLLSKVLHNTLFLSTRWLRSSKFKRQVALQAMILSAQWRRSSQFEHPVDPEQPI